MLKKITYITFLWALLFARVSSSAQTIFWTETFNNGCTSGCLASGVNTGNGAWSIDNTGGCNDTYSNKWFISCAENGNAVGTCGTGCAGNATLHIGADDGFFYDIGASYDAGGAGGCGFGGTYTYTRAVSPLISSVGKSGIIVSFSYLEYGDGSIDDGWTDYSTDGGTTWSLLVNTAKTTCCGGPCNSSNQGRWGSYTSPVLPAAADNNPNLRIRFVWTNNDDGIGNDPSYAINHLTFSYTTVLPIELLDFSANYDKNNEIADLNWSTATEKNNALFTVQRSADGETYTTATTVKGAGNSSQTRYYSAIDPVILGGTVYYRLMQTDYDGQHSYSKIVPVDEQGAGYMKVFPDPATSSITMVYYASAAGEQEAIHIYDCAGRPVERQNMAAAANDENSCTINIASLAKGVYIICLTTPEKTFINKFVKR